MIRSRKSACWCSLALAVACVSLGSCVDEDKLAQQIKNAGEGDFGHNGDFMLDIEWDATLAHIPLLIEKMNAATGDIGEPTNVSDWSPRYIIQRVIQQVLLRIYLERHPEKLQDGFGVYSTDNSLAILAWWEQEKDNILNDRLVNLPDCMSPMGYDLAYGADAHVLDQKTLSRLKRAKERNAAFKKAGYRTINEMLKAKGLLPEGTPLYLPKEAILPRPRSDKTIRVVRAFVRLPILVLTGAVLVMGFVKTRRKAFLALLAGLALIGTPVVRRFAADWRFYVLDQSVTLTDLYGFYERIDIAGWLIVMIVAVYAAIRGVGVRSLKRRLENEPAEE